MKKRSLSLLLILALLTFSVASLAESQPVNLVMSWWGNQVRNEGTTKVLEMYAKENGISIDGQFYQWGDYWDKMATSAAGHSLPDIIQMDRSYIDQYVQNGQLVNLTPYIESGAIDTENISESVLVTGKVGDGIYGIPAGLSCPCLMYNKTLTDSLGIEIKDNMTLTEFMEVAKEITEKSGYRANLMPVGEINFTNCWARAHDLSIKEPKCPAQSYEDYIPFFGVLESGIKEGWHITPDCVEGTAIETDPLVYGSSPETMAWCTNNGGSNLMAAFQAAAPEGMEIGITTLPSDDPKKSNSLGISQYFCVSTDCKNPEAAVALLNWLINSNDCNGILLGERGVPASSSVVEYLANLIDKTTAASMSFVVNVIEANCSPMDPPAPEGTSEVRNTLGKLFEAIGYNDMTAEQAAQEYYDKMIEVWGK